MRVQSELVLPLVDVGHAESDVEIVFGAVPVRLRSPAIVGAAFEAASETYLLRVDDVARFLVTHGRKIVIDPCPGVSDSELGLFLLNAPLGVLLHQRGHLVFHASSVARQRAICFAGVSGAGKSTIAGAFVARGWQLVSDDLLAVDCRPPIPVVLPALPKIKLWRDAAVSLGHQPDRLPRVRPFLEKREVSLSQQLAVTPKELAALFVLSQHHGPSVTLALVPGAARLKTAAAHTVPKIAVPALGRETSHFRQLMRVLDTIPIVDVQRPSTIDAVHQVVEQIEMFVESGRTHGGDG